MSEFKTITLKGRFDSESQVSGLLIVETHVNYQVRVNGKVVAYDKADWAETSPLPDYGDLFDGTWPKWYR